MGVDRTPCVPTLETNCHAAVDFCERLLRDLEPSRGSRVRSGRSLFGEGLRGSFRRWGILQMRTEQLVDRRAWATYDSSKRYRYTLGRMWNPDKPRCAFIMLNPSTATEFILDPTVNRCVGYAKAWGYGSLEVGNLFALRSTDPKRLYEVRDPVGPDNDVALVSIVRCAELVIAAWGAHGELAARAIEVSTLLREAGVELQCLGQTRSGEPLHPLYLSANVKPRRFENGL